MSEITIRRLQALELFTGLRKSELRKIDRLTTTVDVAAGRTLCAEGTRGSQFFVLLDGVANLHASNGSAAMLGEGAWFGEQALLDNAPRNATVTTVTHATLLVFGRQEFRTLQADHPTVAARLGRHVDVREPAVVGPPQPGSVHTGLTSLGAASGH